MTRLALLLAVLVACESDREQDCKIVREILTQKPPLPRRDWSYEKQGAQILDASPFERLKKAELHDADVKSAVKQLVEENGWTFYTPYSSAEQSRPSPYDRLAKLCGLPTVVIQE